MSDSGDPSAPPSGGAPPAGAAAPRRIPLAVLAIGAALLLLAALVLVVRHIQSVSGTDASAGRARGRGPWAHRAGAATPVSVAAASRGDIEVRIPALGTVTPLATVTVRTQISGILQKIAFTEGQLVHRGELLAQIDPRPYEAAVRQMEGALKRDRALLADAKLDLQRYEGLVKEDSIAVQQRDTQRALVDQYLGTVESDEGQLETARVNLLYTRIVSPVDGRVGLRQVDQGNYVTPGDANGIVVVNQMQPISVIFPVPEDDVPALLGKAHGAALEVDAYDRNGSVELARGKLLTLDNQIDVTTGTVKLRALFDNADGALFPNQFVNIELLQDVLHGQVLIPNSAVRRGAPNGVTTTFVYVVNAGDTVSVRPVTLGVVQGDRAAVTAGLAVGERVVTEGGDRLRDGARVQLPAPPLSAAPADASAGAASPAWDKKRDGTRGAHRHKHARPDAP